MTIMGGFNFKKGSTIGAVNVNYTSLQDENTDTAAEKDDQYFFACCVCREKKSILVLSVIIFFILVGSITFGMLYKFTDVIKKHGDNNDFVYEETLANYLVDFTGASYCVETAGLHGNGATNWTCEACKNHPNVHTPISTFHDVRTQANGFVAYDPDENRVLLVFAGTDPLKFMNWVDDLKFIKVNYTDCENCLVHKGFYNTWESVNVEAIEFLENYLQKYSDAALYITGHSLGGAVSLLASVDILNNHFDKIGSRLQRVYTYGCPRVGNQDFSNWAMQTLDNKYFRVTHRRDIVPHVPLFGMGFAHPAREVFYNHSSEGPYMVCDGSGEDPYCSNIYNVTLVTDHLKYCTMNYFTNYLGCRVY